MSKKTTKKKSSRMSGRPTKFTDGTGDLICELIAEGSSASSACKAAGIRLSTLYRWLRSQPAFSNNYARAREDAADTLVDELMRIAQEEPDVHRARLKIDARKWIAARMKPKSWGDKFQVDQTTRIEDVSFEDAKTALTARLKTLAAEGVDIGDLIGASSNGT